MPTGRRDGAGCSARPIPSAEFPASSRRAGSSSRCSDGTRSSTSKWSPCWIPGRRKPCTSTSDTSPEASRVFGFVTPRICISSNSAARSRRGSGVAARAVQTGHQPDRVDPRRLSVKGHGDVAHQPRVRFFRLGLVGALRSHRQPVEPRTTAQAEHGGPGRKPQKMPTFHASLHSFSIEKSQDEMRKDQAGILPAAGGATRTRRIVIDRAGSRGGVKRGNHKMGILDNKGSIARSGLRSWVLGLGS